MRLVNSVVKKMSFKKGKPCDRGFDSQSSFATMYLRSAEDIGGVGRVILFVLNDFWSRHKY